jgi:DNA-binding response OmpR family regulator
MGPPPLLPATDSDESRNMSSYQVGSFILDGRERHVRCDGCPISLTPKVFDTLVYLVERHGHLVGCLPSRPLAIAEP